MSWPTLRSWPTLIAQDFKVSVAQVGGEPAPDSADASLLDDDDTDTQDADYPAAAAVRRPKATRKSARS